MFLHIAKSAGTSFTQLFKKQICVKFARIANCVGAKVLKANKVGELNCGLGLKTEFSRNFSSFLVNYES